MGWPASELIFPDRAKQVSQHMDSEILSMADIKAIICAYFGISEKDITSHRRDPWVVIARHMAMYFCHCLTMKTSTQIGAAFCRDHSTALYGIRKITETIAASEDETINEYYEDLAAIFEDWRR